MKPSWPSLLSRFALGAACVMSAAGGDAPPPPAEATIERPAGEKSTGTAEEAESKEAESERPAPLAPVLEAINPARLQRAFDRWVGLDSGDFSERPAVPEFGEPVFFDLSRPIGDSKYGNELNYLFNSSSRNGPTLQVIEYEYTPADWRAVELDLSYYNGNLQILTPFYQRTLGVGRKKNWAHAYQVSLDIYTRSGFIGGSPVYVFSWKPEEESRFSTTLFVGANRALIGGFNPTRYGMPMPVSTGGNPPDKIYGSWRPTFNFDFFYKLSERWSVAIENDLFFQGGRASEYLSFPFVTYRPGEHAFYQVGMGYYHFESRDQFTFLAHVNFVNASPRKPREADAEEREAPRGPGRLRGWLGRLMGDR